MEEKIPEARISVLVASADEELTAAATPPLSFMWRALCFLALRVANAVFYAMCAPVCLVSVSVALSALGRRIGSSAGARVVDAGNSLGLAGACLYPLVIFAMPPYALFAMLSSKEEVPAPPRRESKGSKLDAVRAFLLSDPVVPTQIFYLLTCLGCLPELFSVEQGSFWEKAGSLLLYAGGVGAAVMTFCFVIPSWIRRWRAGHQKIGASKKN